MLTTVFAVAGCLAVLTYGIRSFRALPVVPLTAQERDAEAQWSWAIR